MARQRKNATFTLDQTYGSGHGDRTLIQAFYARLNELYPGSTPVPIPPESQVHPQHDVLTQAYIFADFAARKIAPIALRAVGLTPQAAKLEQLEPITNEKTANVAIRAANVASRAADVEEADAAAANAAYAARDATYADADADADAANRAAAYAAYVAYVTAHFTGDATWQAVNEMLQAL